MSVVKMRMEIVQAVVEDLRQLPNRHNCPLPILHPIRLPLRHLQLHIQQIHHHQPPAQPMDRLDSSSFQSRRIRHVVPLQVHVVPQEFVVRNGDGVE